MSLINEALKKARQAQDLAPVRETAPPLRAPEEDHPRCPGSSLVWPTAVAGVILIGGLMVWFGLGRPDSGGTQTQLGTVPEAMPLVGGNTKAVTPAAKEASSTVSQPPALTDFAPLPPVPAAAAVQRPSEVAESAVLPRKPEAVKPAPASAAVAHVAPPPPPPPKLQGILYNPSRPTAVVNNKLVATGSRVAGMTVVEITQQSVTLAGGGQTNVLSLSE